MMTTEQIKFSKISKNHYSGKVVVDGEQFAVELLNDQGDGHWYVVVDGQYQERCKTLKQAKDLANQSW